MKPFAILPLATAIFLLNGFPGNRAGAWEPLRAHPQNPYIFEFRQQPTVLRTFAEQYSSVINSDFDFIPYLNVLQRDGMNLTRVFLVGFRLQQSTPSLGPLAPAPAQYVQPWPRSTSQGNALDGLGKWDLSRWNDDYFVRLNAFAQACADRGIVIELTLFCTQYDNAQWVTSPFHPANNVQGFGPANRYDSARPIDANLLAVQEAVVRRIVRQVNHFDNIYFEIQNEPFWNEPGIKDAQEVDFHNRMLAIIRDEESRLDYRHLVAHNFPAQAGALSSNFDIVNEHYPATVPGAPVAGAEALLRDHYARGRILGLGETAAANELQTRLEAWMFLLGGGGIYNGLDVVHHLYSAEDETGDNTLGRAIRGAVRNLGSYVDDLQMPALRRDLSWISSGIPAGATLQAMAKPGQQYVAYLHHGQKSRTNFQLAYDPIDTSNHTAAPVVMLEQGTWRAVWTRPADLAQLRAEEFTHPGGAYTLAPVVYQADVALRIDRVGAGDVTPPPSPTGLSAVSDGNGAVTLSWNAVHAADLALYYVYRSEDSIVPTDANHRLGSVPAPDTSFFDDTAVIDATYYYATTAVDLAGNESAASPPLAVRLGAPVITSQPVCVSAGAGSSATFRVTAEGSGTLSYQWRFNGSEIAGAVAPSYTIDSVLADHAGTYDVVVSNAVGSTISAPARLKIPTTSVSNGSFEADYQGWVASGNQRVVAPVNQVATDGIKLVVFNSGNSTPNGVLTQTFATAPGQTYLLSFDMGVLAYNNSEQRLQLEVTGSGMLLSQVHSIFGSGGGNTRWQPKSLSFTADGPEATLTFRDRSPTTNALDLLLDHVRVTPRTGWSLVVDSALASAVNVTVSPPDDNGQTHGTTSFTRRYPDATVVELTAPETAGPYRFQKWRQNGTDLSTSHVVSLSMDRDHTLTAVYVAGLPLITVQPQSLTVGVGGRATFRVTAESPGALSFRWRFNGAVIPGAETSSHIIDSVRAEHAGRYDVVVSNTSGSVTSDSAMLTVLTMSLANGGFESGYQSWSASGNQRIQSAPANTLPDGVNYVAFNAGNSTPNGVLFQTFATNPGQTYLLEFHMGVLAFNRNEQRMQVDVSGNAILISRNFSIVGTGDGRIFWVQQSFSFTADRTTSILTFRDRSPTTQSLDLLLDNVRVIGPDSVPNGAPTAVADAYSTAQDTALVIAPPGVLDNDTDAEFNTLSAVLDAGPNHGSLTLHSDGGFTYMPFAGYSGEDSFSYHANDGDLNSAPVTVDISISRPASELVANGSFEFGYQGWIASGNQRIQQGAPNALPDGINCVAFNIGNSAPNGILSQTMATRPGQTYLLSFSIGVLSYNTNEQRLEVSLTGNAALVSRSFSIFGGGGGTTRWLAQSLSFTADGTETTLMFKDRSPTTVGLDLLLDSVRVPDQGSAPTAFPQAAFGLVPQGEWLPASPSIIGVRGGFKIGMPAPEPGRYRLERSRDLLTWDHVDEIRMEGPGMLEFTDTHLPGKSMFYRIGRMDPAE